jgi:hypothetical protein
MIEITIPVCPRCEYDLRGETVQWDRDVEAVAEQSGCPLSGRCTECGLEFAWGDIFSFQPKSWFIENATTVISPARCVSTWLRAIAIAPFWNEIRMENKPRERRMAEWLAWLALLGVLAASACFMFSAVGLSWRTSRPVFDLIQLVPGALATDAFVPGNLITISPVMINVIAGAVMYPLVFMLLPETRRRSKVSQGHIVRAATYGLSWAGVVLVASMLARCVQMRDVYFAKSWHSPAWGPTPAYAGFGSAHGQLAWVLGGFVWSSVWWLMAIRTGFRIKKWGRVWLAVLVPATVASLCFPFTNQYMFAAIL